MKLVILDRKTLGNDVDVSIFDKFGQVISYDITKENETLDRVKDADVVITNKVLITKEHMDNSKMKLICISATGTNNVDLVYAKEKNIEVKNVAGYSSSSVTQVAFSMIFHFVTKLNYYKNYVDEGNWQKSDIFTHID
ncbi:MAG: hydroxyacid dehydrogenase, partial [Arcobacter sp.]|nr:hydroxyacid dehydrogenase [Arcobacter sp.]